MIPLRFSVQRLMAGVLLVAALLAAFEAGRRWERPTDRHAPAPQYPPSLIRKKPSSRAPYIPAAEPVAPAGEIPLDLPPMDSRP